MKLNGAPPVYSGFDYTSLHWPVKKAIVKLPIRLKRNSKGTSINLLSPLGAQDKDLGAASQTLLTSIRLYRSAT